MDYNSTTPIETLIKRYENDITFDAHQVETRVNRSDARKEMQRRGRDALGPIGAHLFQRFPIGGFFALGEGYWDHFLAWGWLLFGIIRDHDIPEKLYMGVHFGDQNMDVWIAFCFRHATLPAQA